MAKKTEESKEQTKTKSKSETKKLEVLSDLVEKSDKDYAVIIGCLVESGLYQRYNNELYLKQHNLPVEPSITEDEFNKIIKLLGV